MRYWTRIKRWGFRIFVTLFALAAAGYWVYWSVTPPQLELNFDGIREERANETRHEEQLPANGEVALAMRSYLDKLQSFLPPGKYHPNSPFADVKKVTRDDSIEYRGEFYNDFSIKLHHNMTLCRFALRESGPSVNDDKSAALISQNEVMKIMNNILETIGSEVRVEHPDEIKRHENRRRWSFYKYTKRHGIRCARSPAGISLDDETGYLVSLGNYPLTYTPEYKKPRISSDRAVRIAFRVTHAPLHAWWARLTGADMDALLNPPELIFMDEESISSARRYSWARHKTSVPPGIRLCWEVEFSYFPGMNCPNHTGKVTIDSQTGEVIEVQEGPGH